MVKQCVCYAVIYPADQWHLMDAVTVMCTRVPAEAVVYSPPESEGKFCFFFFVKALCSLLGWRWGTPRRYSAAGGRRGNARREPRVCEEPTRTSFQGLECSAQRSTSLPWIRAYLGSHASCKGCNKAQVRGGHRLVPSDDNSVLTYKFTACVRLVLFFENRCFREVGCEAAAAGALHVRPCTVYWR